MLKRLIWGMIKSALSPIFITLSILRKIKFAILKLLGGSRKAANAAADATTTAKDAAEQRSETSTAETKQSEAADTRTGGTGAQTQAESQYRRFQNTLAGYVVYVALLPILIVLISGGLRFLSLSDVLTASLIAAALPAVLAGLARIRSKITWGMAFGITVLLTVGNALSFLGLGIGSTTGILMGQSPGFGRPLLYLLLLGEFAFLGFVLRTGWKGRHAVLNTEAATETDLNRDADVTTPAEQSPPSASVADTRPTTTDDPAPETSGTAADRTAAPKGDTTTQAAGRSGTPDTAKPTAESEAGTTAVTENREEDIATEESAEPAGDDEDSNTGLETALGELETDVIAPGDIHSLGAELPTDSVPDDAAAVLEEHADADDPDVRLAVCEVCAGIGEEWAEEILKRRRIDTDDRVVSTAIDGLR